MFTVVRSLAIRGARFSHTASVTAPQPRGNIKEAGDFLKAIGRGCDEFAGKFESWESLFTADSRTMRNDFGIPTKQRKYILSWRELYKQGKEPYAISLPSPKKK
ncbi:IGR protein motif-domain-containing protein [Zychaea mexicana]|uniref:IGR protein motif-domain-containing protein n=1 Tax=Zychaea mexicana TaxID=64656 RepID=UPI0022FEEF03|nr:IGR protein motif-domain-containing protein [Zychaea mexicana]KAI9489179.1 IGR protein motif-domain-containing protein [Zychaea mexicana]